MDIKHAVGMFSGGLGSWAACKLYRQGFPEVPMTLLFADVKFEDEDLYRFLPEAAANIGVPLEIVADGRDIWQVFRDRRMLGNTRLDPCSETLKRKLLAKTLAERFDPETTVVIIGFGPEERDRQERAAEYTSGFRRVYPLIAANVTDRDVLAWCEREGLTPPALYDDGFGHNNCKGGCVKAGVGTFVHLLRVRPQAFAEWERGEESVREHLGRDVSILRDRRGGQTKPMPLRVLRERVGSGEQFPSARRFACGCMSGSPQENA